MHDNEVTSDLLTLIALDMPFTDILIEQDQPVVVHTPLGWQDVPMEVCAPFDLMRMQDLFRLLSPPNKPDMALERVNTTGEYNCARDLQACRLRAAAFSVQGGAKLSCTIRRQPLVPPEFAQTGLPHFLRTQLNQKHGLILVTGPTGSGKTTSLASMVDYINSTRPAHIVTIEDPIEFVHPRKKGIVSPKEVPDDTPTFAAGLKAALRERPNVLVVGEIRDRATAELVFEAGESGHLVLATMHTNSATGALLKLLSWFPDESAIRAAALSEFLLAVVTQALVPVVDGTAWVLATEAFYNIEDRVTDAIKNPVNLIDLQKLMDGDHANHHSMNRSLVELVRSKIISEDAARSVTPYKKNLEERLSSLPRTRL